MSNPKPRHTAGGSGPGGARQDGRAGRGRAGRDAHRSVCPGFTVHFTLQTIVIYRPGCVSGSTNKRKSMEKQNLRLTCGLSAELRPLFVLGCLASVPAPAYLSFVNPFPGHALHEKGLQKQKGVGTLVSSQERKAAVVPLSRWCTANKPRVNRSLCSSVGLNEISFVRASEKTFRKHFSVLCGAKGSVAS